MSEPTAIVRRLKRPPAQDGAKPAPKIFIATPAYGGQVTVEYMMGLRHLTESLTASGLQYHLALLAKESLITRARNKLAADFRASDCTHLLFIDADVGFNARDFKALLDADVDVVCGAYPMKNLGWKSIHDAAKAGTPPEKLHLAGARYAANFPPAAANGLPIEGLEKGGTKYFEVLDAATGFLLISRACIEGMIAHYGKALEYTTDYEPLGEIHHRLFDAGEDPACLRQQALANLRTEAMAMTDGEGQRVIDAAKILQEAYQREGPGRYLSEDYYFSRLWQMMGGKIWLSFGAKLTHTGVFTFHGDIETLLEAVEVPAPAEATGQ
jgi:hypothetical protein